uniref:Tetratricopeptide repeat domain 23 like n=1 Tax=Chelydra serpentina TaxID=8475 RepID=A0A8C3RNH1_CHESE
VQRSPHRVPLVAAPPHAHSLSNRELIRCVALARIIYGDGHWQLAQAFANLAHSYVILQGLPTQAIEHAESAKRTMLTGICMPPATPEDKREILGTLVTIYYTLVFLDCSTGKESYLSLQKAERLMEELQELDGRMIMGLKISEKDLVIALGRTCLQQNKLDFATGYFEKAVDAVISTEGDTASELINLYQKIAQSEQLKKNHEGAIAYLLQAHSICVALHKKLSVEAAQTGLLLGKAYAATGDQQHIGAAEMYFTESLVAYQAALGSKDSLTLTAIEEFSKWLLHVGKKQVTPNTSLQAYLGEILVPLKSMCWQYSPESMLLTSVGPGFHPRLLPIFMKILFLRVLIPP